MQKKIQNSHTWENHPSTNTSSKTGINPNNNFGIKICFHLDICTKYQYLIGIIILISTGIYSFIPFVDVDNWYNAFT